MTKIYLKTSDIIQNNLDYNESINLKSLTDLYKFIKNYSKLKFCQVIKSCKGQVNPNPLAKFTRSLIQPHENLDQTTKHLINLN